MADSTSKLSKVSIFISDYPRQDGETDDTGRFNRAISYLNSRKGGKLILDAVTYNLQSIIIPNSSIVIEGQGKQAPWATQGTWLKFLGNTGVFITINSYYYNPVQLRNLNIVASSPNLTASTIGVLITMPDGSWAAGALIENVSIYGFGIGVRHSITYESVIKNCNIWECGTGISYYMQVSGATQNPSGLFGDVNLVARTTVLDCNVGVELAGDILNNFRNCDFERCQIAVLTYSTGGGWVPPSQHRFENCWFEANTKYVVCNSSINATFNATGSNSVSLPLFTNCNDYANPSPAIPSFNTNYQYWTASDSNFLMRFNTDDTMQKLSYNTSYSAIRITAGNTGTWRDISKIGNGGGFVKMSFNAYNENYTYVTTSGAPTTKTVAVDYSAIINPDINISNYFSSMSIMAVGITHNDGSHSSATFLVNDMQLYDLCTVDQIGSTHWSATANGTGTASLVINNLRGPQGSGYADKMFDVVVTANAIKAISFKYSYLPNGLLLNN
jgi:hypothetical protein